MAHYYQGEQIVDYFTIIDDDSTVVTGALVVLDTAIDPDGSQFPVTLAEVGNGVYSASFTADKVGEYYYRLHTDTTDPPQYFEVSVDVEIPEPAASSSISGATDGTTLFDLIRDVAMEVGDFREAEATEDGAEDGTSFVSDVDLAGIPTNGYAGASFWIASPVGENWWIERRVASLSESSQTIVFTKALPARTFTGDTAWFTNLLSRGWPRNVYRTTINAVIQSAFPRHLIEDTYTYPDPLDGETWSIAFPPRLTHVYRVASVDFDGNVHEIPMSYQLTPGYPGWGIDSANSRFTLGGDWVANSRNRYLSIYGYSKEGNLVEPGDATQLESGYIVPEAARRLTLGKRDAKLLSNVSMHENQAMYHEAMGITQLEPNTVRIR